MMIDAAKKKENEKMMFDGRTLLITGGTGSFGHAVVRRFLDTSIGEIRILSRDEKKQEDMRIRLSNSKLKFYIGDVRDYDCMKDAMHGVDYVFHAAALKQVPSCEFYPLEAMRTNTIGAANVLNAAVDKKVKMAIVLSTDKAVYPINAMGLSKAMMEKVMVAKSRLLCNGKTIMCGTRYGNVMASRGSVIPLFLKQISAGKPLTVTDPNMTRFLMSLDSAVDLVLYAFENGRSGELFVKKAPGATIGDLAKAILKMMKADNPIKIIGTRHGEKLYETLLTREELMQADDCGEYYRICSDDRGLDYNLYFTEGREQLSSSSDYNSHNARRLSVDEIVALLEKERIVQDILEGKEIQ